MDELKKFIGLLKHSNRKVINAYKTDNFWIEENEYTGEEKVCKDADVLYNLGRRCDFDIMKYLSYIDEDDFFNSDCKFKNRKMKLELFKLVH